MHCVLGCKVILSDYKDSGVIVRPSPLKVHNELYHPSEE